MTAMTTYLEDAYLNHMLGNTALPQVTTPYVKLHIGDPTETGAANPCGDTTRQPATFGAAASLAITTTAQISWTLSLGGTENISHFSIWDTVGPAGGNALYYGAFAAPQDFNDTDVLDIAIGDLDLTMSGNSTTYSGNAWLDHTLGVAAFTQPPGQYVKLYTADPTVDPGATGEYADTRRISATFNAASAGAADNSAEILWSSVTADATVSHIAIFDAAAAGQPLLQQALTTSKALVTGNNARFAIGALDLLAA